MTTEKKFGKTGIGHLEMIISFVFFVGFIFFLFTVLKPYDTTTLSSSVISGLYNSFREKTQTNLTDLFIKADYTGSNSCFYIQLSGKLFKYNFTNSLVKSVSNVKIESKLANGDLNIGSKEGFYKVEISPEFSNGNLNGCDKLSNYSLGSLIERQVVSYSSLVNMSDRYKNDYDGLKFYLNVPEAFDFGITSEQLPEINMERLVPHLGDVVTRGYILEVLKNNGEVINTRFTIKVW